MVDLPEPESPVNHMHVAGATQRKFDAAHRDGCMGGAVDQNEAAECAIFCVGCESDVLIQRDIALRDFIQKQSCRREVFLGVHIDFVFDAGDLRIHCTRSDLHQVAATGHQRCIMQPQQLHRELVGDGAC